MSKNSEGKAVLSQGVPAARMKIAPSRISGPHHLAIRPYPQELEEWITLRSGEQVLCRPIRPEDEPAHQEFFARLFPVG